MKIMIRKKSDGKLVVYVPKKDLEEAIVSMAHPGMWGGLVTLANGWELALPDMPADTPLPISVDAQKISG